MSPPHGFLLHEEKAIQALAASGHLLDASLDGHVGKLLVAAAARRPGRPASRRDDFRKAHGPDFLLVLGDEVFEWSMDVIHRWVQHRNL